MITEKLKSLRIVYLVLEFYHFDKDSSFIEAGLCRELKKKDSL
jgi:hypothetical protein